MVELCHTVQVSVRKSGSRENQTQVIAVTYGEIAPFRQRGRRLRRPRGRTGWVRLPSNDPKSLPRGRAPGGTTPTRPSGASATSSPPTRSRRARENRRTGADALANARTRIAHAVRGSTRTKNDGFPRRASSVSCASSTCAPGLIGVVHLKPYQECF